MMLFMQKPLKSPEWSFLNPISNLVQNLITEIPGILVDNLILFISQSVSQSAVFFVELI